MKESFGEYFKKLLREYPGNGNRGAFFTKMLMWYAACTVTVFLIFGMVMSISMQKNYRSQIEQLNERAISQSVSACTAMLRNLYNYYDLEILDSAELTEILLAEEHSVELAMRFKKLRTMLVNYNDIVESCYVINLKDGFVCSTMDTYHDTEDFPDQDILRQLELIRDIPGNYELIPRKTTYNINGTEYTRQYLSLILKKYQEGYLVINLDYEAFADMVNYRDYDSASRALLINDMGLVLADSGESMFGVSVTEEEFYTYLEGQNEREGSFTFRTREGKKKALYCKNQLMGISYVILTDEELFGGNALLIQMIFCAVAAVILNLFLILLGTCVLYRPIYRLGKMFLPGEQKVEFQIDEFKAMEQIFSKMRRDSLEYSQSRRRQMLRELLDGRRIQGAALHKEKEAVREHMNRAFFICVNLYPNVDEEQSPDDFGLMKFSMENILRELLEGEAAVESVDYGSYITCIVNVNDACGGAGQGEPERTREAAGEDRIFRALRKMQEKMEEFFGVDVSCSVGFAVNSLEDITESYEEALVAAFFQMTREKGAILYSERPEETGITEQGYPGELVKEILDGIKGGDKGKIRKEISAFFEDMMSRSYHQAMRNALMLEMEIARLEMKYGIYEESISQEYMQGVRSGGRLYKMRESCLEHCLRAAEACAERRENNPNMTQLVDRVKELVEQKLTDHTLCVNSVAQEIYLSAGYVRSIFKEVTGQTLSNYIISRKLAMVCRLLRETDWSVQQIADHMEFSSRSYLYTFFKNYMGVTPNQYRKREGGDITPIISDEEEEEE